MTRFDDQRERWNRAAAVVLAQVRRDHDLNQTELGELIGVTRNVIANIESGRKGIELSDMLMICQELDEKPLEVIADILDRADRKKLA